MSTITLHNFSNSIVWHTWWKNSNVCLWENFFSQIWVSGVIIWKIYMQWYLFFLETVRNSANFLLMSAIPETSSMTIRRSIEVFSLQPELLSLVSISLVLNLNFSINLRVLLPDETQLRYWSKAAFQLLFGRWSLFMLSTLF